MKVTYGDNTNKKVLKLDDVVSIKAANGEGEALIAELHQFGNSDANVFPKELLWIPEQKAWFHLTKNKVLLFNVAPNKATAEVAVDFVAQYLNQDKSKNVKTVANIAEAVVATDQDSILTTDSGKALQVHKPSEKNQTKNSI